ncbi:MAG TPA: DUF763 domain-containing protein, partial [Desulfobacteria bacterium]|nr:DUF763 domain-containing protein [Desulfobacteria bacterium]
MRSGTANLPLHGGKCPAWLFAEMKALGTAIVQAIIYEYGAAEVLKRLSDPFWFQALGCVLGFDWHSSGVTTTVCGALKEGLREQQGELGIFFAGGKGKTSRKTPMEIDHAGDRFALNNNLEGLKYASRMAAKIDNNALQDGFQIYHHFFAFTRDGEWAVIQQGMNEEKRYARRYHWLSSTLNSYVSDPHSAISCDTKMPTLNLVAAECASSRDTITALSLEPPDRTLKLLSKIGECPEQVVDLLQSSAVKSGANPEQLSLFGDSYGNCNKISAAVPALTMPAHHYVPRS